jgi:hypothetical protein
MIATLVSVALIFSVPQLQGRTTDLQGVHLAQFVETSEERPPAICPAGSIVRSLGCKGSYCDDVGLDCVKSEWTDGRNGAFTGYFSEETYSSFSGNRIQGYNRCPRGTVLAGLSCQGSYCDNVALYCVEAKFSGLSECFKTIAVSEETGQPARWPRNFVPVGIQCFGSYCDNVSVEVCKPDRPIPTGAGTSVTRP